VLDIYQYLYVLDIYRVDMTLMFINLICVE